MLELIVKIKALAALKTGWLEGRGIAPSANHLDQISKRIAKHFPNSLEYPSVASTEDGHVLFEWMRPQARVELEVNLADHRLELYATNAAEEEFFEQVFNETQWRDAFVQIEKRLAS
jgi:hypothetical protein